MIIHHYIDANEIFSKVLDGAKLIKKDVPIKFEALYNKGFCTDRSLFIDFSSISGEIFGIKNRIEAYPDYLIYGLDQCEGYLLLPENVNRFFAMIEDRLETSVNTLTCGYMDYI